MTMDSVKHDHRVMVFVVSIIISNIIKTTDADSLGTCVFFLFFFICCEVGRPTALIVSHSLTTISRCAAFSIQLWKVFGFYRFHWTVGAR